jgi:hypothetical protein
MVTRCRDDPENVQWKLIKMGEGAPAEGGSRALLDWAKSGPAQSAGVGVDQAELDRFVKRVVTLFTEGYVAKGGVPSALPEACALLRDAHEGFHRSVDIFDFSERNTMRHASEVVTAIDGRELDNRMLVLPVGDALQEPFWPEGLGVNRGMHNALDAVWTANQWGTVRDDQEARVELVRKRQSLYESKTLQMSGKTRGMLKGYRTDNSKSDSPKPAYSYTPDPTTRYNDPIFASETRYVDSIRCSVRAE